jgi:hypothetical protein
VVVGHIRLELLVLVVLVVVVLVVLVTMVIRRALVLRVL